MEELTKTKNSYGRDLTGQTFGHYTVLKELEKVNKGPRLWLCVCKCGQEVPVLQNNLARRPNQMCRVCWCESRRVDDHYKSMRNVYEGMIGRCYSDSDPDRYAYYGGRGIIVRDRWRESDGNGFKNFFEDMAPRPEVFTLDRIDPNDDYYKENCRWVSKSEQSYNRRKNTNNTSGRTGVYWIENLSKWEVQIGVDSNSLRIGWYESFEEACAAREEAELKYYGYTKE